MTASLSVLEATRAAVTDLGRFGSAHLGIQVNGAADQVSARTANILVGNPDGAPVLETSLTPLGVRTQTTALVAVTGAVGAATIDGVELPLRTPVLTWPGAELRIEPARAGVHSYLAVHGTARGDLFRGSVAVDPLLGRGRRLAPGDSVEVHDADVNLPPFLPLFRLSAPAPEHTHAWTLDVLAGPEADQFPGLIDALPHTVFTVGTDSDQAGTRLEGQTFRRVASHEILSRGVPLGAVEVPPAGGLIALQRGRPMTAGYPVAVVVARASHHLLAQVRPGDDVRLRLVDRADALRRLADIDTSLSDLRRRATAMYDACGLFDRSRACSTLSPAQKASA